jgi:hypothetical protein
MRGPNPSSSVVYTQNVEIVGNARTSTSTGVSATVNVIRRAYEIGRKVAEDFKDNMSIIFDDLLPKWNYCVVPQ